MYTCFIQLSQNSKFSNCFIFAKKKKIHIQSAWKTYKINTIIEILEKLWTRTIFHLNKRKTKLETKSSWCHLLHTNPVFLGCRFPIISWRKIIHSYWTDRCWRMFPFLTRQTRIEMRNISSNKFQVTILFRHTNCSRLHIQDFTFYIYNLPAK